MIIQTPTSPNRVKPVPHAPKQEEPVVGPFIPAPPKDIEDAGLDPGLVEALILKYLAGIGSASGGTIATELCLPRESIIALLSQLKQQQIVVYVGSAAMGDFTYRLTEFGRERAHRFLEESMYVGPAPVPIAKYVEAVQAQTITAVHPKAEDLRRAFSDLLINREMFEILGPAINSGRGMFLYGYPGNGKTSIAERISLCFGDHLYIPRCLVVDGQIIELFDAANHERIEEVKKSIIKEGKFDDRWVKIKRPTIVVGGELTMADLEIQYNPATKTCEAPVQLKSNSVARKRWCSTSTGR